MEPDDGGGRRRGACLSILLTGGAVCLLLMLVVLATAGWAVHLVWIGMAIVLFGLIHYARPCGASGCCGRRPANAEEEEVRRRAEGEGKERRPTADRIACAAVSLRTRLLQSSGRTCHDSAHPAPAPSRNWRDSLLMSRGSGFSKSS